MNLNVTYDSTTLSTAPSQFFTAVNYVISLFDKTFTNNVTVNVEVGYGEIPSDNSKVPPLGESYYFDDFVNYAQARQALVNQAAPGSGALPSGSPLGGKLVVNTAEEKALGLIGANSALDGYVGVASNATLAASHTSWSFDPTATPASSQYYIVGTLEHEFTEVMGRVSNLDTTNQYSLMDLYRYQKPGVRQTGAGDAAYFSIDGGQTNLDSWNNSQVASGDLGDWAPKAGPSGVFKYAGADAFLNNSPPGQINGLTPTDLTLMAALGWETVAPVGSANLGASKNYTLVANQVSISITDKVGNSFPAVFPALDSTIAFTDQSLDGAWFTKTASLSSSQIASLVELYIASFNRAPDALGLDYWGSRLHDGMTLDQIAKSFFVQPETIAAYPSSQSTQAFVTQVYNNVLGRAPDTAGLNYWLGQLGNGAVSKDSFLEAVINGAQASTGSASDALYLANKELVGAHFALTDGLSDLAWAKAVMAGVTGTASTVTAANAISNADLATANTVAGSELIVQIVGVAA